MAQQIARRQPLFRAARWAGSMAVALATLAGCGGGDVVVVDPTSQSCSLSDQKSWLHGYMKDWYFWYAISPNPSASSFSNIDDYFTALLYTGTDANFPADRWSYVSNTDDFNRFFGEGSTLGYGLMVAGKEISGHPELPLLLRYIEPGSPAALAGLQRGDQLLAVNGQLASTMVASNDYSLLSPTAKGQPVTLDVFTLSGATRQISLQAAVYDLVPVTNVSVFTTVLGRKVGYLQIKDMISQVNAPLDTAMGQFQVAGVQDLVLDLRYNSGGLVSVAAQLASYVAAARTSGQVFTNLLYNNRHQSSNQSFYFNPNSHALNLSRVYVLTGSRTCSASELIINALSPFVEVVTIGDTTCGKPVGFNPIDDGCGSTWSAVTFESSNAINEGRYFDGFDASCPVAEDFSQPLGSMNDPLLATALADVNGSTCSATLGARHKQPSRYSAAAAGNQARLPVRPPVRQLREPGERGGMLAR